jgi:hypothetical protein
MKALCYRRTDHFDYQGTGSWREDSRSMSASRTAWQGFAKQSPKSVEAAAVIGRRDRQAEGTVDRTDVGQRPRVHQHGHPEVGSRRYRQVDGRLSQSYETL